MFPVVGINPFNDDSHWYYALHEPIQVSGTARSLSITTLPPPPSLTVLLLFASQTIYWTMPGSTLANVPMNLVPTETKVFTMDINSFTNRFSADQAINSMFMNTRTGRAFSPERRLWMVTRLSEPIRRYVHSSISTLDANIFFQLNVVDEMHRYLYEEIEENEEHFRQNLQEESFEDHEEEFFEDVVLSICPAPQALVESLKTEVYQSEDGEAKDCVICLEELVPRVEVKRLPCSHCFHVDCIDGWFQRKDTCPLCRIKLQAQS